MSYEYLKEIKRLVSCRDVCEHYGIRVNTKGFANCIFHEERTDSMRIYDGTRGFHCFGCGKSGDGVDIVQKLFGLKDVHEAAQKINDDFRLGLPIGQSATYRDKVQIGRALYAAKKAREREERERQAIIQDYINAVSFYAFCDNLIKTQRPATPDDEPSDLFVFALQHIGAAENELEHQETRRWLHDQRH